MIAKHNEIIQRIGWPAEGTVTTEYDDRRKAVLTASSEWGGTWVFEGETPDGPLWTLVDAQWAEAQLTADGARIIMWPLRS